MTGKNLINLLLFLFLSSSAFLQAGDNKLYEFKIGHCHLSSVLHPGRQDTSVFLSYRFLEKILAERLVESGIKPSSEPGAKFVEFNGHNLTIRGQQSGMNFRIIVDGRFYQKKNQREPNMLQFDFELTLAKEKQGFFDSLLNLVTLPVGLIFEAVLNVVFAATHVQADVMDYVQIDVKGKFSMTLLKSIGAAFVNLFLPSDKKINVARPGKIEVRVTPKAIKMLDKMKNFEAGYSKKGLLVYFY